MKIKTKLLWRNIAKAVGVWGVVVLPSAAACAYLEVPSPARVVLGAVGGVVAIIIALARWDLWEFKEEKDNGQEAL